MRSYYPACCVLLAILTGLETSVACADIYKSVDANGQVTYSDRRLSDKDQLIELHSSPPSPTAEQDRTAKELEQLRQADEARKQRAASEALAKAEKLKSEAARQDRCRQARNRLLTFTEENRLYRRDAKGERVYYTSAEIDAERAAAQQAMKESCDATNGGRG